MTSSPKFGLENLLQPEKPTRPSALAGEQIADRMKAYGDPKEKWDQIAALWNAILGDKLEKPLAAADALQMMRLVKESRLSHSPEHFDSLVDVCGYADLQFIQTYKSPSSIGGIDREQRFTWKERGPVTVEEWELIREIAVPKPGRVIERPIGMTSDRFQELVEWHNLQIVIHDDVSRHIATTASANNVSPDEIKALLETPVTTENLLPGIRVKIENDDTPWCILGCIEQSNPVYHLARHNKLDKTECRDVYLSEIIEIV